MNPFSRFQALTPAPALLTGTVQAVLPDGSRQILLPSGGIVTARGDSAAGARVFVRGGVIEGDAPALTVIEVEM